MMVRLSIRPPAVTVDQMRRLDAHAVSVLGIPAFTLMDHAGRAVAEAARRPLQAGPGPVIAVCGGGHNGGDGIAAARWLKGWGFDARVLWLRDPAEWKGSGALHAAIARRTGVPFQPFEKASGALRRAAVILDALLGTGFQGPVRGPYTQAINAVNAARKPTVAIDIPSGLDADTGRPAAVAVRANVTVTFVAAKRGLLLPSAKPYVGRLVIADIGIPYRKMKT